MIIWGGLIAMVALGLAYAFRPQPVLVDMVTLERGPMTVTLDEEGETRVRDVYVLSAPVAGRVQRIDAEVGDQVKARETVVASIQPTDPGFLDRRSRAQAEAAEKAASAALTLARAELDQAEAELDFAENDLARARRLRGESAIAERTLDLAESTFRIKQAAVDMATSALEMRRFELENARAQLVSPVDGGGDGEACDCVPITSPVDGQILEILHKSEGVVQAGEALVDIGDPDDLEIVADFLSADAVQIEPGQNVLIEDWGGAPLLGEVRRVEPAGFTKVSALGIEEQRVNVIVDFDASADDRRRLSHGYRVEIRVVLWEDDDALKLPLTALFRDGERWAVFVEQDGRARLRHVEVGRRNGVNAEILTGLEESMQVVRHPSDQVSDDVLLEARS
ncbi:MAG: HlyD family efflux transporter periplasmic adaptor subunit [Alphaproteobacteria bacterium]|nr:HlyD family efflux transporter periplasmic adaptor subunit [Alphaproteobacteria bacterium]